MIALKYLALASLAVSVSGAAQAKQKPHAVPHVDLADTANGSYHGSVISDSRGSGREDVTITVTKTGPNTVSVSSSYPRLPTFTVKLTRAMQTIQQVGGGSTVFLLNLAKTPRHLDITIDGASWSGDQE